MPEPQTAIFLSPHFDDIALSCAGIAARMAKLGARCVGVTVFAAPSHEGDALSPFAEGLHRLWKGASEQPVQSVNEVRREEDRQALRLLGLKPVWLDFQDAPYRRSAAGEHLYTSDEGLFGKVMPQERQALVPRIAAEIGRVADEAYARGRVRVFAPLGVGNHVDHQIVFHATRRLGPRYGVLYYEDYPYAGKPGALAARLKRTTQSAAGRRNQSAPRSRVISISDVIGIKVAAIARYKSQLGVLFSNDAMPAAVRAYAQSVAGATDESNRYAERFWQLPSVWTLRYS